MAHAKLSPARFAHQSKRRNERGFQRILAALFELRIFEGKVAEPRLHLRPELHRFFQELGVTQFFILRGERIDLGDQRLDQLQVTLVFCADEPGNDPVDQSIDSHHNPSVFFGIRFHLPRWLTGPE